jgi:hypothetical protein
MENKSITSKGQFLTLPEKRKHYKIITITPGLIETNIEFLGKDKHLLKALMAEKKSERKF